MNGARQTLRPGWVAMSELTGAPAPLGVTTEGGGKATLSRGALSWILHQGARRPYCILNTLHIFPPYFPAVLVGFGNFGGRRSSAREDPIGESTSDCDRFELAIARLVFYAAILLGIRNRERLMAFKTILVCDNCGQEVPDGRGAVMRLN